MNKMYEYLKNHAYISYNKKSTYEFEISEERAKCIANKYDNLIEELQQENKQLKDLIDTILNFSLFKEECPLNFEFENNTNEDKSQSIFYEDQWCENNCNDNYKDCWLKYFKKLQELEQGSDSNEKNNN